MISKETYDRIKNLPAPKLKYWLNENKVSFSDLQSASRAYGSPEGRFCSCCGANLKADEPHDEECVADN